MSRSKRAKRNTRRKRAAQRAASPTRPDDRVVATPLAGLEPAEVEASPNPVSPPPTSPAAAHPAPASDSASPRHARLRIIRLWLIGAAIGIVTLGCVVGGAGALLAHATPSWWVEPGVVRTAVVGDTDSADTADIAAARGRAVEEAISHLLSSARPGTVTRTALYESDANAWLETRLPRWLEAEETPWPDEVSALRVQAGEGRMRLAVRVTTEGWSRVVTLTVEPRLDEEGRLWAPARALHVGRLRLPLGLILGEIETSNRLPAQWRDDPRTRFAVSVFAGDAPLVESPVIRIDERRLRLTALDCVPERFDLAYEVERRD